MINFQVLWKKSIILFVVSQVEGIFVILFQNKT